MLKKEEFNLLIKIKNLEKINNYSNYLNSLISKGYVLNNEITLLGLKELNKYKVDNAIIMAAGMSSRFTPLCYESPKALLIIKNEVLIERQIKQLLKKNITDITIVVGYMKEKFYYLKDKYNINIVENNDFNIYNNTSSLMKVLNKLNNTYILSCDNYFSENVFDEYNYESFYSTVYSKEYIEEYCVKTKKDIITDVKIGDKESWYMLGHVYFDNEFSSKFKKILFKEYNEFYSVKNELWEKLYMKHINELFFHIKKYNDNIIYEFDSLDELREFDSSYYDYDNSLILKYLCNYFSCKVSELSGFKPNKGTNNLISFYFYFNNNCYLFNKNNKEEISIENSK